jgi:hypothetical protein
MDVVKTARSVGLDLLTLPSHTSHAEEDYLNQLEDALTTEPQEELRSPRSHFYIPPVECDNEDDTGWGEEIGFSEHNNEGSIDRFLVLPHQDIPSHDPLPKGSEP